MIKFLITFLFIIVSVPSWATTYYVRSDGGTDTQCTGTTDAQYPGSGTGQPCAFSHNYYATGFFFNGSASTHGTMHMSGGDTLIFSKSGDTFKQGADAAWTGCTTSGASDPYDCIAVPFPSGTSGAHTKIYGFGGNTGATSINTFLYGVQGLGQVINTGGNNGTAESWVDYYNLDLSGHFQCEAGGTAPPVSCSNSDNHVQDGIGGKGVSNVSFNYITIHRAARYCMQEPGASNFTYNHLVCSNNGYGGLSFDDGSGSGTAVTGTMTMNQPDIEYSGCSETFPGGARTDCWGQDSSHSGYGDGIAFAGGSIGQWTITGPGIIGHNTQDGFDGKHGIHTGDFLHSSRMTYEGNAGQQVKMESPFTSENDYIVGNCWYFSGKSYTFSGFVNSDMCRASGNTFELGIAANEVHTLTNDTIIGNGDATFLVDTDAGNDTCNSSTKFHVKNSIIFTGTDWHDDATFNSGGGNKSVDIFFNGGTDGNGAGTCGATSTIWDEDYNEFFGNKNSGSNSRIVGVHSAYTDPLFSTDPTIIHGTYTQNDSFPSFLTLTSSSPGRGIANTGLTYLNGSSDYNSNARPPWDLGSVIFGSSASVPATYDTFGGSLTIKGVTLK